MSALCRLSFNIGHIAASTARMAQAGVQGDCARQAVAAVVVAAAVVEVAVVAALVASVLPRLFLLDRLLAAF
jgi:hypothetical protein